MHIPSSDVEEDIQRGESSNDEGMGGVSLWGYTAEGEEVWVRSGGGVKANLTDLNLDCDLGWGLSLSESVRVCPVSPHCLLAAVAFHWPYLNSSGKKFSI
jgi:hypothetical protein